MLRACCWSIRSVCAPSQVS